MDFLNYFDKLWINSQKLSDYPYFTFQNFNNYFDTKSAGEHRKMRPSKSISIFDKYGFQSFFKNTKTRISNCNSQTIILFYYFYFINYIILYYII